MNKESLRWQFCISLHPAMILDFGSLNILLITILQLKKEKLKTRQIEAVMHWFAYECSQLTRNFCWILLLDFGNGGIVAVVEMNFRNLGIGRFRVVPHRALHRNLKILLCCKQRWLTCETALLKKLLNKYAYVIVTLMAAKRATAAEPIALRFLRPAPGIILTWLALLVLKLATMLLESTELKLMLLLLLLLLFWIIN